MTKGIKGCNKLNTMNEVWLELDGDMKAEINRIIDSNGEGSSLLRLFKIYELPDQLDFPTSLFDKLMTYYENVDGKTCFRVGGGQWLNVTLEDVLYLTGLPIRGKPVFPKPEKYKDFDAFHRVFGRPASKEITFLELKEICIDKNKTRSRDERMKAILLYIVNCIIIPNSIGKITTSYVHFVEKLDEVDSYSWGAAALAFLYEGLSRYKSGKMGVGFVWLVLGFFFCHFNIKDIFGVEFNRDVVPYTLSSLVKELSKKIGGNHYSNEHNNLGKKLMKLGTRLQSTD
ncbi:Protein MAIN-LIKE 2, partial [Bienertia sinuspersici]